MDSYILHPDGTVEPMPEPANRDGTFTLEQLQAAVDGMIAIVPLGLHLVNRGKCEPYDAILNEEGLLHGLERNPIATYLLSSLVEPIVGKVLVTPKRRIV